MDLLQQLALANYLWKQQSGSGPAASGDASAATEAAGAGSDGSSGAGKLLLATVVMQAGQRVFDEVYCHREIDAARDTAIAGIVEYVRKNPKASQADLARVVATHVQTFSNNIRSFV